MSTLGPYSPRAEQMVKIDASRDILIRSCLQKRGDAAEAASITINDDPSRALAVEREADSVTYGITDTGLARRYRYSPSPTLVPGSAPQAGAAPSPQPLPNYDPSPLPPVVTEPGAPSASPRSGLSACVQYAQAAVFGGRRFIGTDPFALGQQLAIQAWLTSQDDARVRAAWSEWRACMNANDLWPTGTPVNPEMFVVRVGGQQASAAEVTAALTDIGCKRQVDLVGRWSSVVSGLERAALKAHRTQLTSQATHLAETLQRAQRIIETGRP